jgi:hypothetical protein
MTPLERRHLERLCKRFEVDPFEIDSSLTYWENKRHLRGLVSGKDLEALAERESARYEAQQASREPNGHYHKGALCPKCGKEGSGLHVKWVLNEQKRLYEPYYSFAHSVKVDGHYRVKWHYVRKAHATALIENNWTGADYNLRTTPQ